MPRAGVHCELSHRPARASMVSCAELGRRPAPWPCAGRARAPGGPAPCGELELQRPRAYLLRHRGRHAREWRGDALVAMSSPAPRRGGPVGRGGREAHGPLHAAPSFADAPGGCPLPARERMEGGAVRPPAAPASSKAGMPRGEREQRRGGTAQRLAGRRQGPASPSAVLTSLASPRAAPAEAPTHRALFRGEGGRRRWRELTGGLGFCKGKEVLLCAGHLNVDCLC